MSCQGLFRVPVDRVDSAFVTQQEGHQVQGDWVAEDDIVMLSHGEVMEEGVAG